MSASFLFAPPVTAPVDDKLVPTEPPPELLPLEPDESAKPPRGRRWLWIAGAVAGLFVLAVVVLVIWAPWRDTTPRPPASLSTDSTGAASVGLQWAAPDGGPDVDTYVVVLDGVEVASVDGVETSFLVTDLTPNTAYEFVVVSVVGDVQSEPSAAVSVTTDPGTPLAPRAENLGTTSVELRWDAPDGPSVDAYVILDDGVEVGSVDVAETSLVVSDLTPNTAYEFVVVSMVGDVQSEPSAAVSVTTDPGTPLAPRAENLGATSVELRWDAPDGPSVDAYVIINEGNDMGVVTPPATSFRITDLIPGASYDFQVVAEAGVRQSTAASISFTTIAPSPRDLVADPGGTTIDTIVLNWSPPEIMAPTEYIVIRDGETVASVPGDTLSYTDTGLAPATAYRYQVAAGWGYEPSDPTATFEVATAEPPIADARLVGSWRVDVTLVSDPGANQDEGTMWTNTWTFTPTCESGACDATLSGSWQPPGFEYKGFTIDLVRDGASYVGSVPAQITYCDFVPVDNTVTVRLTVDEAGVRDGQWTATSWSGTLKIASPYTDVGIYYCPAQSVEADLVAAI